jgi:hypothetical protein
MITDATSKPALRPILCLTAVSAVTLLVVGLLGHFKVLNIQSPLGFMIASGGVVAASLLAIALWSVCKKKAVVYPTATSFYIVVHSKSSIWLCPKEAEKAKFNGQAFAILNPAQYAKVNLEPKQVVLYWQAEAGENYSDISQLRIDYNDVGMRTPTVVKTQFTEALFTDLWRGEYSVVGHFG